MKSAIVAFLLNIIVRLERALDAGMDWLLERFERLAAYGGSDEYRAKMKDLGYGQKE